MPATCSGAAAATVRKSCTGRIPAINEVGAIAHPTRQPVTEYVFERALIVTVRSSMPGIMAIGTCSTPSYTMCS